MAYNSVAPSTVRKVANFCCLSGNLFTIQTARDIYFVLFSFVYNNEKFNAHYQRWNNFWWFSSYTWQIFSHSRSQTCWVKFSTKRKVRSSFCLGYIHVHDVTGWFCKKYYWIKEVAYKQRCLGNVIMFSELLWAFLSSAVLTSQNWCCHADSLKKTFSWCCYHGLYLDLYYCVQIKTLFIYIHLYNLHDSYYHV